MKETVQDVLKEMRNSASWSGYGPQWADRIEAAKGGSDSFALVSDDTRQHGMWCVHMLGPDDVHPAPNREYAQLAADKINAQFGDYGAKTGITITAVVVPYAGSAENHAAGVADFIPNFFIPEWQVDALTAQQAKGEAHE